MRRHWRKLAYAAFWVVLLIATLESFIHPEADNEARAVMFGIIILFAAPISFIPLLVIYGVSEVSPEIGSIALPGGRPVQFMLWWLLMFAISYWQWFHLTPKLTSKFPGAPEA